MGAENMNASILSNIPPYSRNIVPECFMSKSRFKLEIAKSPNWAKTEITNPNNKHFKIGKFIKNFKERQTKQALIKLATAPPIVLFGLTSGANFFVNFDPTIDAIKSPIKTATK